MAHRRSVSRSYAAPCPRSPMRSTVTEISLAWRGGLVAPYRQSSRRVDRSVFARNRVLFFARPSAGWLKPAVHHSGRGLRRRQDRSWHFPNFLRSSVIPRIVKMRPIAIEFAQAGMPSFCSIFAPHPTGSIWCELIPTARVREESGGSAGWAPYGRCVRDPLY